MDTTEKDTAGYVYLVAYPNEGKPFFKAGTSKDPRTRINALLKGERSLYCEYFFTKNRFEAESEFLLKLRNCGDFQELKEGGHREYFFGDVEEAKKYLGALHSDIKYERKHNNQIIYCPYCQKDKQYQHIIWCMSIHKWENGDYPKNH